MNTHVDFVKSAVVNVSALGIAERAAAEVLLLVADKVLDAGLHTDVLDALDGLCCRTGLFVPEMSRRSAHSVGASR